MKAIAKLREDFTRIIVMGSAEGEAVVKEHTQVGDI